MSKNIQILETRVQALNVALISALSELAQITGVLTELRTAQETAGSDIAAKPRTRPASAPVIESAPAPEVAAPVIESAPAPESTPVAPAASEVPAAPVVASADVGKRVRRNTQEMAEDSARSGKFPVQYKGRTPEKQAEFRAEVRAAEIRLGLPANPAFAEAGTAPEVPAAPAPVQAPVEAAPEQVVIVAPQSSLFSEVSPTSPDVQPEIEPIASSTEG